MRTAGGKRGRGARSRSRNRQAAGCRTAAQRRIDCRTLGKGLPARLMQSAFPLRGYRYSPSFRARATGFALSLATCLLILLMLIKMGAFSPVADKQGPKLVAISVSPQASENAARTHVAAKSLQATPSARKIPDVQPIQPPVPRDTPVPPLRLLKLSNEQFAAADLSKMGRPAASGSSDSGSGQGSASAYGPGEGPGGAKLYNAQWYREPTEAEMVTYMPHRSAAGGWAVIACRTEEHYHVSDCHELGESPPGSGLSRALRQAAWQFLVRPPRVDGRPMIGSWVRIRFNFTVRPAKDSADPSAE
jgi:protein TonB